MAINDVTPPGKGDVHTHRSRRAFLKSCDASRAVVEIAETVTADFDDDDFELDDIAVPLAIHGEGDSLVIAIKDTIHRVRQPLRAKR